MPGYKMALIFLYIFINLDCILVHESGRIWVSPLFVDVILGPSIVKSEINLKFVVAIE